jgi:flagellar FliL protein
MATEQAKTDEQLNVEEENSDNKDGNFFSKYGKIFLIAAILLIQAGVAYAVVSSYYGEIYEWVDGLSSKGNIFHTYENIIINPAESDGERYLILSIVVEVNSGSDAALLEKRSAKIIDKVNLILTQRTPKELTSLEERDEIKQEIGLIINDVLNKNAVRNLFFTKYVLQ